MGKRGRAQKNNDCIDFNTLKFRSNLKVTWACGLVYLLLASLTCSLTSGIFVLQGDSLINILLYSLT